MIPSPEFFEQYFRYVMWADDRQLALVRKLPAVEYHKDRGFSFGTIHRVLLHEMSAESIWLDRFEGVAPIWLMDDPKIDSLEAIERLWPRVHERSQRFIAAMTPEKLAGSLHFRNLAGNELTMPLWSALFHMCQHAYYHRGQLSSMIKLACGETASTDFSTWMAEQGKAA